MTTIFLLDDHEVVRRGIRELLELEPDLSVVGEAATATDALAGLARTRPDVALLDARLPDGSGIDVCRVARSERPELAVIIFTSYDDEQALEAALLAGAAAYLLKNILGQNLAEAIRRVAAGANLLDDAAATRLRERWASDPAVDRRLDLLTPQERRILLCIADGMTNREIGRSLHLAEKTVKNYVTSVLGKLGTTTRTQAAVYAVTHDNRRDQRPSH